MSAPVAKYTRKGNVYTIDFGVPAIAPIVLDYDKIPEEERAGIAKAMLSAATLACYVGTLGTALEARGAEFEEISGEAHLVLGQNAKSQARITGIDINVEVNLSEDESDVFERCKKIMNNGCLVTASVHEGVHMNYNLTPNYDEE